MSTPTLITPDQLEADATVPQCLDNQYVPNEVFAAMVAPTLNNISSQESLTYAHPAIHEARTEQARTEFIRSLVYSTQVILNRAFFVNSPIIYGHYRPGHLDDIRAFGKLLASSGGVQAIVPYLHKADCLADPLPFEERREGREALDALLDYTGDAVTGVRLDRDPVTNLTKIAQLEAAFGAYFSGNLRQLLSMPSCKTLINEMAAELFGTRSSVLQVGDAWSRFQERLNALAECAFSHSTTFDRSHVYKEFLMAGGSCEKETSKNVAAGKFRAPRGQDEFIFEIKKLVDLVYNTNLPDKLKCYTFTPVGLPSRMALQDFMGAQSSPGTDDIEALLSRSPEYRQYCHHIFLSNAQHAMALPLLSDLSLSDVVEIRNLDAWRAFSEAQQSVLVNPLGILNEIGNFTQKFDDFQRQLSNWYFRKYAMRSRAEHYANFATLAVHIGGRILIALGFPGEDAASVITRESSDMMFDYAAQKSSGFVVELMVSVVDLFHDRIDPARSYSIELMRGNTEYTREQVQDLARRFFPNLEPDEHVIDDTKASELPMQGAKQS